MKNLRTLAKGLDFATEIEYFDYCIDSYIAGQMMQCKELFAKMKKEDKKELLRHIKISDLGSGDAVYNFYFNLL